MEQANPTGGSQATIMSSQASGFKDIDGKWRASASWKRL